MSTQLTQQSPQVLARSGFGQRTTGTFETCLQGDLERYETFLLDQIRQGSQEEAQSTGKLSENIGERYNPGVEVRFSKNSLLRDTTSSDIMVITQEDLFCLRTQDDQAMLMERMGDSQFIESDTIWREAQCVGLRERMTVRAEPRDGFDVQFTCIAPSSAGAPAAAASYPPLCLIMAPDESNASNDIWNGVTLLHNARALALLAEVVKANDVALLPVAMKLARLSKISAIESALLLNAGVRGLNQFLILASIRYVEVMMLLGELQQADALLSDISSRLAALRPPVPGLSPNIRRVFEQAQGGQLTSQEFEQALGQLSQAEREEMTSPRPNANSYAHLTPVQFLIEFECVHLMGECFHLQGKYQRAASCYKIALQLSQKHPEHLSGDLIMQVLIQFLYCIYQFKSYEDLCKIGSEGPAALEFSEQFAEMLRARTLDEQDVIAAGQLPQDNPAYATPEECAGWNAYVQDRVAGVERLQHDISLFIALGWFHLNKKLKSSVIKSSEIITAFSRACNIDRRTRIHDPMRIGFEYGLELTVREHEKSSAMTVRELFNPLTQREKDVIKKYLELAKVEENSQYLALSSSSSSTSSTSAALTSSAISVMFSNDQAIFSQYAREWKRIGRIMKKVDDEALVAGAQVGGDSSVNEVASQLASARVSDPPPPLSYGVNTTTTTTTTVSAEESEDEVKQAAHSNRSFSPPSCFHVSYLKDFGQLCWQLALNARHQNEVEECALLAELGHQRVEAASRLATVAQDDAALPPSMTKLECAAVRGTSEEVDKLVQYIFDEVKQGEEKMAEAATQQQEADGGQGDVEEEEEEEEADADGERHPMHICCSELPLDLSEADVKGLVASFSGSELKTFQFLQDSDTGKSKGVCFFSFIDPAQNPIVVAALDGFTIGGSSLSVRLVPRQSNIASFPSHIPTNQMRLIADFITSYARSVVAQIHRQYDAAIPCWETSVTAFTCAYAPLHEVEMDGAGDPIAISDTDTNIIYQSACVTVQIVHCRLQLGQIDTSLLELIQKTHTDCEKEVEQCQRKFAEDLVKKREIQRVRDEEKVEQQTNDPEAFAAAEAATASSIAASAAAASTSTTVSDDDAAAVVDPLPIYNEAWEASECRKMEKFLVDFVQVGMDLDLLQSQVEKRLT